MKLENLAKIQKLEEELLSCLKAEQMIDKPGCKFRVSLNWTDTEGGSTTHHGTSVDMGKDDTKKVIQQRKADVLYKLKAYGVEV